MKIQQLEPDATSWVEVDLGPNDILVLSTHLVLRPDQREALHQRVIAARNSPDACLILDGGIRFNVLKRA